MTTEERLEELELKLKMIQRAFNILAGAIGGLVATCIVIAFLWWAFIQLFSTGSKPSVQNVVRSKVFEVVADDGKSRAIIGLDKVGSIALGFFDQAGTRRIQIGLEASKASLPYITLSDAKGTSRFLMGIRDDGTTGLALLDDKGNLRANMDVNMQGLPVLTLIDKQSKVRTELGLGIDGGAALGIADGKGQRCLELGVTQSGETGLLLFDKNGRNRAAVILEADGKGHLILLDENGVPLLKAP